MSTAAALLAEARSRGLILTVNGPKISYTSTREAVASDLIDRLRAHKAELLKLLAAEPVAPAGNGEAEKNGQTFTNYGRGFVHPDGRIADGRPEPTPPPAEPWPADLSNMLRRIATCFEWSAEDRKDFIQWARRSPGGLEDARVFLQSECDKLDRRMMGRAS